MTIDWIWLRSNRPKHRYPCSSAHVCFHFYMWKFFQWQRITCYTAWLMEFCMVCPRRYSCRNSFPSQVFIGILRYSATCTIVVQWVRQGVQDMPFCSINMNTTRTYREHFCNLKTSFSSQPLHLHCIGILVHNFFFKKLALMEDIFATAFGK